MAKKVGCPPWKHIKYRGAEVYNRGEISIRLLDKNPYIFEDNYYRVRKYSKSRTLQYDVQKKFKSKQKARDYLNKLKRNTEC